MRTGFLRDDRFLSDRVEVVTKLFIREYSTEKEDLIQVCRVAWPVTWYMACVLCVTVYLTSVFYVTVYVTCVLFVIVYPTCVLCVTVYLACVLCIKM